MNVSCTLRLDDEEGGNVVVKNKISKEL